MYQEDENSAYREAYPEELSVAEKDLLKTSRKGRTLKDPSSIKECTGIGLSGGGIRSATFCLGVFQSLASRKLLSKIDFLSTVSGGGYFGSFYTRFFLRKEVHDFQFMADTLTPGDGNRKTTYQLNVINWLRENGRYLAPRGSGDLLLAGSVLLRNWIVVQVVIAFFFLLIFLTAQLLRIQLDPWFQNVTLLKKQYEELVLHLPGNLQLWVSPFAALPVFLFLFGAIPCGWAYWMLGRPTPGTRFWRRPWCGLLFVVLAALLVILFSPDLNALRMLATGVLATGLFTACWSMAGHLVSARSPETEDQETGAQYREAFKDELSRSWVSVRLKNMLVVTGAALAFAAIDSLGQTVYLVLLTPGAALRSWLGGLLAALISLAPFATRIMITLRGANGGKSPNLLVKLASAAAAFLIITTALTTYSVAANAIAWTLQKPANTPADFFNKPLVKLSDAPIVPDQDEPNNWKVWEKPVLDKEAAQRRNGEMLWGAWVISLALSFLFGQSWPFLNRSTQLPLYSARLIRAYLGASNQRRFQSKDTGPGQGGAITRVIPGDDIDIEYYWPWPQPPREKHAGMAEQQDIYRKGTPLHLVNVTINETLDSKSQVQQQDRKGVGMALGPAGISAGVRHHVVFDRSGGGIATFPREGFRMFHYGEKGEAEEFAGERLPLGQWLGISGAAISTGLGAKTNLALSLLTGAGNIRLGYWWDSGIDPCKRPFRERQPWSQRLGAHITRLFPVQSYLLDEYTARYHGPARQHWYLSNGGHFENMGGYELIRRRLRLIIIVDAEADPDYNFEGLAGLIRKARTDFGAEISFLNEGELEQVLPAGHRHCFSTLERLRRGKWVEENLPPVKEEKRKRQIIDPVDYGRYSLAHAAIARVSYDGKAQAESCLIYLKPTVTGDEPPDVLQYHVANPCFPQQTTADQFFDEAQWESHRKLGEHIAGEVFQVPEGEDASPWWDGVIERVLA